MNEFKNNLKKYANLLLDKCLVIENNNLYISVSPDAYEFAYIIYDEALSRGIKNVDLDFKSKHIRNSLLKYKNEEELYNNEYFDRSKLDKYTKNNYAFLFLEDFTEINEENNKLNIKDKEINLDRYSKKTCEYFRKMEGSMNISWCIACVATKSWACKLFPNDSNAYEKLWNLIFDICFINSENPSIKWDEEMNNNAKLCEKLNNLKIKKLCYKNSLGTDFSVEIGEDTIFLGSNEKLRGEIKMIVNLPSFEIFTSPLKNSAQGIVYSSRPLVYNGKIIDNFYIKFDKGKVVEYDAEVGKDILDNIINTDDGSKYLGEVALVEYKSKISQTGICFYHTLYDENSSCHLALGSAFPDAIKNFDYNNSEEYEKKQLNKSITHVDFMIGTKDLNITALTYNNKEIKIFENGNFTI